MQVSLSLSKRSAHKASRRLAGARKARFEPLEDRRLLDAAGFTSGGWSTPPQDHISTTGEGIADVSFVEPTVTRYHASYSIDVEASVKPPIPTGLPNLFAMAKAPDGENPETRYGLSIRGPGTVVLSGHGTVAGASNGLTGMTFGNPRSRVSGASGGGARLGYSSVPIGTVAGWSSSILLDPGESESTSDSVEEVSVEIPDATRWLRIWDYTKARVKSTVSSSSTTGYSYANASSDWSVMFIPDGDPDIAVLSAASDDSETVT